VRKKESNLSIKENTISEKECFCDQKKKVGLCENVQ